MLNYFQGWRVGWALSTPALLKGLAVYHGNTSYCAPSPLQHGLAIALAVEDGSFEVSRQKHSSLPDCLVYTSGVSPLRVRLMYVRRWENTQGGHLLRLLFVPSRYVRLSSRRPSNDVQEPRNDVDAEDWACLVLSHSCWSFFKDSTSLFMWSRLTALLIVPRVSLLSPICSRDGRSRF